MGLPAQAPLERQQRAWFMYDWANSAYSSTVVTLFLGPYLTAIAKSAASKPITKPVEDDLAEDEDESKEGA